MALNIIRLQWWIKGRDPGPPYAPPPPPLGKKRKESQREEKLAGQATKNPGFPPPRSGSTTELSDDMKENLDAISPI